MPHSSGLIVDRNFSSTGKRIPTVANRRYKNSQRADPRTILRWLLSRLTAVLACILLYRVMNSCISLVTLCLAFGRDALILILESGRNGRRNKLHLPPLPCNDRVKIDAFRSQLVNLVDIIYIYMNK